MALKEFFEDCDKQLLTTFNIITAEVTQKIDILFKKLDQCAITGDASLLKDDIMPCEPDILPKTVLLDSNNIKKRTALANITESVNTNNVTVKLEKLSLPSQNMISNKDNDKMPAPTIFPIKKEVCHTVKRSTRATKKPKRYVDEIGSNSSDVIIQNETIPIIDVTDDTMPTRSTRTKTIRKCTKRKEELVTNTESMEVKKELKKQEDIDSSICTKENEANATYVLMPQLDALSANLTVVIEPSKADEVKNSKVELNGNIIGNNQETLQKKIGISQVNEKKTESEIKKDALSANLTVVIDTSKAVEDKNSKVELNGNIIGNNQETLQKKIGVSQVNEKKTESEIKKALQKKVGSAKAISNKTTELEKEMMQMEKKKALLLAKSEETRKRRELRQLKALQLRQQLEEEKKLEMQKSKKAKYNHTTAVKLRKQLEGPIQKIDDRVNKQTDDVSNMVGVAHHDLSELDKKKTLPCHPNLGKLPVYMTIKMPLLPTDDCYDSDEPVSPSSKPRIPAWSNAVSLRKKQLVMVAIGHAMMNTFFCCTSQTPDLEDIFECINPRKLIRTSSAVWRSPPRYTFLPLTDFS